MKRCLNWPDAFLSVLLCASFCACMVSENVSAENIRTRNAVYNGDFLQGLNGWGRLGPGRHNATFSLARSQYADQLFIDLIVQSPGMRKTFSVYHTPLLKLRQGMEYEIILEVSGEGEFMFGAIEYNTEGRHIGNNYSERYMLTPEAKEYRFIYKPSAKAIGIRPAIAFLPSTSGNPMDVKARLIRMEIPVPEDCFTEITVNWPVDRMAEMFADYKGFTADELAELKVIADVNVVLPPYKPIVMNEPGDFTLTTSRLRFVDSILPERIIVLGKDILAGQVELLIELDDGTKLHRFPLSEPSIRSTDTKAVLEQKFSAVGVEMTVTLAMEYDALMLYSIFFTGTPGISITNVSLSIPLRPDIARYIRYDDFSRRPTTGSGVFGYGPIPAKGESVETKAVIGSEYISKHTKNDWNPMVPGDNGLVWTWNRGFLHTLWIGDEYRGLSFMSLSHQGYYARKDDVTVRLDRNSEEVKLTYSFVTGKALLDNDRKLQFAMQVMPPKPVQKNWVASRYKNFFGNSPSLIDRSVDILEEQIKISVDRDTPSDDLPTYAGCQQVANGELLRSWEPSAHRKYRDIGNFSWLMWSEGCGTPLVKNSERFARVIKVSDMMGHLITPYFGATHIAAEDPAGYYYVEKTGEWEQYPRTPRTTYLRPVCPGSMFAAYIARGIGRMIDEYGISGVYFDNSSPVLCGNTAHGCGYMDEAGAIQGTLPLLGFRKLYMMVRHEFVKRGVEPYIMTHPGLDPCTVSFTDVVLKGEGVYGSDHTKMFTLGEWRAAWLGANQYGVEIAYLPQFGFGLGTDVDRNEEAVMGTPRLLAMAILHGTHVKAAYLDHPVVIKAWEVLDELDESSVTFIPYWEWGNLNKLINLDRVYASAYNGNNRMILILTNLSDVDQKVALPLSEIQTKNSKVLHVSDNMHTLPVSIEEGMVMCAVPAKNFRLLSFTR